MSLLEDGAYSDLSANIAVFIWGPAFIIGNTLL